MPQHARQAVGVALSLIGAQDVSIAPHFPDTESAAISVRIGKALIYMHDAGTVRKILALWEGLAQSASKHLPQAIRRPAFEPAAGMTEPAVLINAANEPPSTARFMERSRDQPYLMVKVGRLVIHVRDLEAFRSTVAAFRQAERLCETTFPAVEASLRQHALESAAKAFPSRRGTRKRPSTPDARTGRDWPPAQIPQQTTPKIAERWMQ